MLGSQNISRIDDEYIIPYCNKCVFFNSYIMELSIHHIGLRYSVSSKTILCH